MSISPTSRSRRPAGTPTGGQFAPEVHAEPEVALGRARPLGPVPSSDPRVQAGEVLDAVEYDGVVFHRRRGGVYGEWPYAMRFQFDRPLTNDERSLVAGAIGYAYRATVAGEPMGWPEVDSPYSLVISADTTKTRRDDLGIALEEFEDRLPEIIEEGSPIRTTNRAGEGTKGTRLVEGVGPIGVEVYYDSVFMDPQVPPETPTHVTDDGGRQPLSHPRSMMTSDELG